MLPYDALPALARPLLDRLLAAVEPDERIVGVTVGGSAATGTMDEFSDLDLILVCRDGDHGAVLGDVRGLAAAVGPLLAAFSGDHVGESRLLIALYGPPLLHVDIKVVALSDLAHRVEDAQILWEREGAVEQATATTIAVWPAPDRQWIEDRFWVWVHYGATKIGRGELFECLELLALLRSAALGPLIARDHAQRPQGVRRLERYAPELVVALAATVGDHSRPGCTAALRTAVDLYRALRARAADPGLKPRVDAEREVLAFLDALG